MTLDSLIHAIVAAMKTRRAELIAKPLDRIWPELAEAAIPAYNAAPAETGALLAKALEKYPELPAEERDVEIAAAREALRQGFMAGYRAASDASPPAQDSALREALVEAREVVDAVAGQNVPTVEWAKDVRDKIDAALSAPSTELADAKAEIERLRKAFDRRGDLIIDMSEALEPFASVAGEAWADDYGWTEAACPNDRICDWFGPSAFHRARAIKEGR